MRDSPGADLPRNRRRRAHLLPRERWPGPTLPVLRVRETSSWRLSLPVRTPLRQIESEIWPGSPRNRVCDATILCMSLRKASSSRKSGKGKKANKTPARRAAHAPELVVITGMSGSGKASVLKAFEDLGYYCVDNLPVGLIPQFAELAGQSSEIERTALVVDVREGAQLDDLPKIVKSVRRILPTKMIFLEAADSVLLRRFSETRRPHPLGTKTSVKASLAAEREHLRPIRAMADLVIDTSKFNVHELRSHITERFQKQESGNNILVSCVSFGFRHGVPEDADLVFDVRFLPHPHFVPEV